MTEHDLLQEVVRAAVMAYIAGGGELGPIQPAIDAVRAVLARADVRLTLPYRLTPPAPLADGEWFVSPMTGGGWAAVAMGIKFEEPPAPDHSKRILED